MHEGEKGGREGMWAGRPLNERSEAQPRHGDKEQRADGAMMAAGAATASRPPRAVTRRPTPPRGAPPAGPRMPLIMSRHGVFEPRGINAPRSRYHDQGTFGRLFPALPAFLPDPEKLRELGKAGGVMDPAAAQAADNPDIPAGFTFLGQFIDHDITFDPTSHLEQQNDPEAIANFRTPVLELDNVYGAGPAAQPHLYDNRPENAGKLLIDEAASNDLPRNSQGTAIIGDPRNDENVIVSQLHLAFLKFHNAVVDQLREEGVPARDVFERAQQLVRWHYQWLIVHEFLPHIVGQEMLDEVLAKPPGGKTRAAKNNGRPERKFFKWRNEPFIPVEFAVAAYRFGHSQARPGYRVNANFAAPLFDVNELGKTDPNDLSGGHRAARRFVEWRRFFEGIGPAGDLQRSMRIDTTLSKPLFALPFIPPNNPSQPQSLAQRNLLRGRAFSLPSGQAVACALGVDPLDSGDLGDVDELGFAVETPLWFYILREADKQADGRRLGPVGGRIVAEVFVGLLEGDRFSFLRANPTWTPTFGENGDFRIADLLKFANATV
jgi:hypothetical protein